MKKFATAAIMTLALSAMAFAGGVRRTYDVPFSFEVRGQEMPAGRMSVEDYGSMLRVISYKSGHSVIVPVQAPKSPPGRGSHPLFFHHDNGKNVLSGIGETEAGVSIRQIRVPSH